MMKRPFGICAVALAACAKSPAGDPRLLPLVHNPAVFQTEEADDYEIRGRTLSELGRQIAQRGPRTSTSRYAGLHSSRFSYSYTTRQRAGKCAADPKVQLY